VNYATDANRVQRGDATESAKEPAQEASPAGAQPEPVPALRANLNEATAEEPPAKELQENSVHLPATGPPSMEEPKPAVQDDVGPEPTPAAKEEEDTPPEEVDYGESDDEARQPTPLPSEKDAVVAEEKIPEATSTAVPVPVTEPLRRQRPLFAAAISTLASEASRKRPAGDPAITPISEVAHPAKVPRVASKPLKNEIVRPPGGSESKNKSRRPTRALFVEGFVRPFTLNQARELMGESGTVLSLWMPSIKNLAYVVFSSVTEASRARDALDGLQWPASSPKRLSPRFVSVMVAEMAIGHGGGNPDFKIERMEDDGPDDEYVEEIEPPQSGASGKSPASGRRFPASGHVDALSDLREMLSKRRSESAAAAAAGGGGGGATANKTAPAAVIVPRSNVPAEIAEYDLDKLFMKTKHKPTIYWTPKHSIEEYEAMNATDDTIRGDEGKAGPNPATAAD